MFEITDTQSEFISRTDIDKFFMLRDYWFYNDGCVPEIGVGLAGFGIFFLFFGMLLLFDKGLLAIGNVRPLLFIYMVKSWICIDFSNLPPL